MGIIVRFIENVLYLSPGALPVILSDKEESSDDSIDPVLFIAKELLFHTNYQSLCPLTFHEMN